MLADKIVNDKIKRTDKRLEIVYVPIEDIFPNEYNPNSHTPDSFDLLIKSVAYFGFTQPIVVHRPTMKIVDGEHRYRVACVLEFKEIPVCFVDFDDEKLRYATLMHNRARGKDNKDLLNRLYKEFEKMDSDYKKVLLLDR
jgi:ParB/RepB/Spo0J family partition protein